MKIIHLHDIIILNPVWICCFIVHKSWLSIQTKHFLTQFLLLLFKWQLHPLLMALQCPGDGAIVCLHVLGALKLYTNLWEIMRNSLTYRSPEPHTPWETGSATWGVQSLSEPLNWMDQLQTQHVQLQVWLRYVEYVLPNVQIISYSCCIPALN